MATCLAEKSTAWLSFAKGISEAPQALGLEWLIRLGANRFSMQGGAGATVMCFAVLQTASQSSQQASPSTYPSLTWALQTHIHHLEIKARASANYNAIGTLKSFQCYPMRLVCCTCFAVATAGTASKVAAGRQVSQLQPGTALPWPKGRTLLKCKRCKWKSQ